MRHVTLRYLATCVVCLAGWTVIAVDHPHVGMALIGLANLGFLIPPKRVQYEPTNDEAR